MSDLSSAAATSAAAASELQERLLVTDDVAGFLKELVVLTVSVLPGELSCGLTPRRDKARHDRGQ
jgi:hypothetical protein